MNSLFSLTATPLRSADSVEGGKVDEVDNPSVGPHQGNGARLAGIAKIVTFDVALAGRQNVTLTSADVSLAIRGVLA